MFYVHVVMYVQAVVYVLNVDQPQCHSFIHVFIFKINCLPLITHLEVIMIMLIGH